MTGTEARDKRASQCNESPWPSRESMICDVACMLRSYGETPVAAKFDGAGNCTICGEAGRCPGVHSKTEERVRP